MPEMLESDIINPDEIIDTNAPVDDFYAEEDEIFPGGPSQEMVDLWKEKYGQIFLTEIENDGIFIWRVLNRRELRDLAKDEMADALYKEDAICKLCVIWPAGYSPEEGIAGTATVLAEQIFEKSGFRALSNPIPL